MPHQSSSQTAQYRIDAFDVKLTDTRRAMCVGLLMRSHFAFFPQLHRLVAPKIDQVSNRALGAAMAERGEESDSCTPAAEGGGGKDV